MKKLTNEPVDFGAEIEAMASFVESRWTGTPDLRLLFRAVLEAVQRTARYWFDDGAVSCWAYDQVRARRQLLAQSLGANAARIVSLFDAPSNIANGCGLALSALKRPAMAVDGAFDFEDQVRGLTAALKLSHPKLVRTKPAGWAELAKGYVDFGGMREYAQNQQRADEAAFEGHDMREAGSVRFTSAVSLSHTMYSDKCQGRSAAMTLVGAAYGHFLGLQQFSVTRELQQAFEDAGVNSQHPEVVFQLSDVEVSPLATCALQLAKVAFSTPIPSEVLPRVQELYAQLRAGTLSAKDFAKQVFEQLGDEPPQPSLDRLAEKLVKELG